MGGFAWVTLATNDSYSLGALVLAHSLKAAGTAHQLAVLVTPGVTSAMRDKLAAVFNLVQEVNILDSRDETNLRLLKRPELGITFTKLHCWRLTQYEKCVFLDADTLVLQYCDELFEREEFSAAPDVGWPDCFNSGVFVYRPSLETYEKLIQFALEKGSFDGGDQGLLNLYFSDWAHADISKHLPFIYNLCSTACYSYLPAFKQFGANAKIIHFIGTQKPWLQYFNTETRQVQPTSDFTHLKEVLQRWWDIFCSLIHPHLSPAMAGLAGAFAQLTLGVARTPEQDALENLLRKQAWEVGNIDYLGKDSFDNIWSKITETLNSGLPESSAAPPASAPADSQSETASPQEPVPPPVEIPTEVKLDSDTPAEVPKDETPASNESSATPQDTGASSVAGSGEQIKEIDISQSQPSPEVPVTPQEEAPIPEPAPIPEKKAAQETGVKEPQADAPVVETKAAAIEAPKTEAPKPQGEEPKLEVKAPEPQTEVSEKPVEKESAPEVKADPTSLKETETAVEPACPLPQKKETPKETEPQLQVTASQSEQKSETPAEQEVPKETSQTQEVPKETAVKKAQKPAEPTSVTTTEPESQPAEVPQETAASPKKPEAPAPPSESAAAPSADEPLPTESSPKTPESPAAAAPSSPVPKGTTKVAASKASPKTKVTEATPPATPSTPPVEKTKPALAAETSIPDTPPPSEGGSTPTPPPRKTDKPKKAATKPKK